MRIDVRCSGIQKQPYTQPAAADELAKNRFVKRHILTCAVRNVNSKITAVVSERHDTPLPSRIGGKNKHAVVFAKRCSGVADEAIAVQTGDESRVQAVHAHEFGE